jgi:hypothetical protein
MFKNNILNLLKSTGIVVFISAMGSLAAYLVNLNYIATFIFLFIIQFIIFSFVGNILTSYFTEKTKQKQLDLLEPLSTILECAYCNANNLMTFFPNDVERIEFECDKCKNKNLVNIGFSVARITEPVNVPNLTGIPLVDEKNNEK